jgi:hypothetical protein
MQQQRRFPVLILAFNRPNLILELLKSLSPEDISVIYISIDGPRNSGDHQKAIEIVEIAQSLQTLIPIKIRKSDINLGCRLGVISGIDWFFTNEIEGGVILEDDCIPESEFFEFLRKVESQEQSSEIAMISAHNPLRTVNLVNFTSRFIFINGWYMKSSIWKNLRANLFQVKLPSRYLKSNYPRKLSEAIFWWSAYMRARIGIHDTWDSLLYRTICEKGYGCLLPSKNFIENRGFGVDATHTTDPTGSIFLPNGQEMAEKLSSGAELDELILSRYFGVKKRHAVTPFLKVMWDLCKTRKFPNFERQLQMSKPTFISIDNLYT